MRGQSDGQEGDPNQEFASYEATTVDTGSWILIGTSGICAMISFLTLLFLISRKRRNARKEAARKRAEQEELERSRNNEDDKKSRWKRQRGKRLKGWSTIARSIDRQNKEDCQDKKQRKSYRNNDIIDDSAGSSERRKHKKNGKLESMLQRDLFEKGGVVDSYGRPFGLQAVSSKKRNKTEKGTKRLLEDDESTSTETSSSYSRMEDASDVQKTPSCCSYLLSLFSQDEELRSLMKLAIPFSVSSLARSIFDMMWLVVIGRLLGTEELTAYIVVYYIVDISAILLSGMLTSLTSLCSLAIGSEKYSLAGLYVQIAVVVYLIVFAPVAALWWLFMENAILWLDFNEIVAAHGQDYVPFYVLSTMVGAISSGVFALLDTSGCEKFSVIMATSTSAVRFLSIFVGALLFDADLRLVGMICLAVDVTFLIGLISFVKYQGWLDDFIPGIFGQSMFANWEAVMFFFKTSTPISIGYVLSYGEWQFLFVLATFLGPAEASAWGILGEVWTMLESLTYGWGDAAEVRCAQLLGAGFADSARKSAHKALAMATVGAVFTSGLLLGTMNYIPSLITIDHYLQSMLKGLFPIVAVGNLTLTVGTMSFQLVGAQARYSMATAMEFIGSWVVSLPLALISSLLLKWDLKGLVAAVVLGYMVSGTLNFLVVCCTDWERRSLFVMKQSEEMATSDDIEAAEKARSKQREEFLNVPQEVQRTRSAASIVEPVHHPDYDDDVDEIPSQSKKKGIGRLLGISDKSQSLLENERSGGDQVKRSSSTGMNFENLRSKLERGRSKDKPQKSNTDLARNTAEPSVPGEGIALHYKQRSLPNWFRGGRK